MTASKNQPTQHINPQSPFDISEAVSKQCPQCGGEFFDAAFRLGIISALSPSNHTKQEVLVRFDIFLCRACEHEFGKPVKAKQ